MKPRHSNRRILPFPTLMLAGSLAAMLAAPSAQAATRTWSGVTDSTWNTGSNWVGDVVPATGDSLIFGATGAGGLLLNNDHASFNVAGITFSSSAGAYVIGDGTATANAGNAFVLTGTVTNGSGNLQTLNMPFSMTAVRTFTGGVDMALAGNISGAAGGILKNGSNTVRVSGTNTYTGATQINMGVLRLDSANAVPGGIGASGGLSNININGGVIGLAAGDFTRAIGTGTAQVQFGNAGGWAAFGTNRAVNLGGNVTPSTVLWGGTATTGLNGKTLVLSHFTSDYMVDFQNPLNMEAVARTVQVDNGSAAIDATLSGAITGIASGNLSKTGFGTLQLTGTNTYVGTTTVSAGTLLVNGNNSGGGAVTVSAGAALGGIGTISGAVTASTGGMINLRDGAVGTLSLTNTGTSLSFSGTAIAPNSLFFDLGNGTGGTDKIVTTGAHSAATANGVLVNLNQLAGTPLDAGTYTLIQGGAASNLTGYTLATTRSGRNLYSALGASGDDLQVTVAAGDAGPADSFSYWQGDTSVWNTAQWYSDDTGMTTALAPGYSSNVRFAASSPANLTNTLGQDYEINSLTVDAGLAATSISGNMLTIDATEDNSNTLGNGITVNNVDGTTIASKVGLANSQAWTVDTGAALTVSGAVSDFGGGYALTKAGAGTLTLTGVNTFTGPVTVSGGTLVIGGAGQLNAVSYGANIGNNGIVSFTGTANNTLSGIISGTGSLTKSGSGILTLNNSGTFTGGATISGGTVQFGPANLVNPLGSGTTTVNATGTYALGATLLWAPLVLNGGTVTSGNSFTSTIEGPMTLDATSTISVSGNLTINGNISGVGGITKTLGAFVPLNGTNTYNGPTVIDVNGGGLTVKSSLYGNDTSKWIPANITVNSGGALVMNVGGAGEFTIGQAGTMFSQLGGVVNNNGLRAGSIFGIDTRGSSGTFTIADNLIDSSGPGGGAVGFQFVGNGSVGGSTLVLAGNNTYSGQTIIDRDGVIKVSSINSVNGGSPPLLTSSLGRPTTIANGTISLGISASFRGGGLAYTGSGETTDRVIKLGGGLSNMVYSLDQSGPGPSGSTNGLLKFTSNLAHGDTRGIKILQLQGSTAGSGEFAGQITNPSAGQLTAVTKSGTGTWTLSAANLHVGVTTVTGGALVLANATALTGGIGTTGGLSALTFNGGVIGLGAGDFTRSLAAAGTVTGVTFTGNGGWAAYGADRVVNLGGSSAAITWATASTGFNGKTVYLSYSTATHTVNLQNPIDLGTAARTFHVYNGAAAVDGEVSGVLSSTSTGGGLNRSGAGTLYLSNPANTYTGATTFDTDATVCVSKLADGGSSSSIGAATNASTNLMLKSRSTLRHLGAGTDTTNRGFTINGAAAGDYATLDASGTGTVNFTNTASPAYGTTNQTRTLILTGTNTGSNTLAANIADNGTGAVSLAKDGVGTWVLTGPNAYTGATSVNNGTLSLGTSGSVATSSSVAIAAGATIDTSGQASYSIPTGKPVAFGINTTGSGTTGTINAAGLDITNATVSYNITGTPDDPVYVLATYTTLTGAAFLSAPAPPAGYALNYAYEGNKIALVPSATPYETWAAGTFTNAFTNTLPGVDFDNDGLSNLLEFVLGGDPTISQAGIAPTASTSGGNLVLTFKRSDASELAPAVAVKVELSTDLTFSTPAQDITVGPATDPGPIAPSGASYTVTNSGGFDTITVTIPQGVDPKKFARVKAIQP